MTPDMDVVAVPVRTRLARRALQGLAGAVLVGATAYSAVLAKEARTIPALAAVEVVSPGDSAPAIDPSIDRVNFTPEIPRVPDADELVELAADPAALIAEQSPWLIGPPIPPGLREGLDAVKPIDPFSMDPAVRWFDGRPIRPVSKVWMTVTGYSPDARSCGESADGLTATLHSVHTNASRLVAADPSVLPYGTMITVPGYDSGLVVPVLDCGGAIKGRRLDLLFPTHEQALQWGVKRLLVTVWGYADGKPAENPRKLR